MVFSLIVAVNEKLGAPEHHVCFVRGERHNDRPQKRMSLCGPNRIKAHRERSGEWDILHCRIVQPVAAPAVSCADVEAADAQGAGLLAIGEGWD